MVRTAVLCGVLGIVVPVSLTATRSAQADVLVTEESQATFTAAQETSPRLGADDSGELVVFTSQTLMSDGTYAPGQIMYQRLNADGTTKGSVVIVSTGTTDDRFNDVSGNYIVYTAFPYVGSLDGELRLYDIDSAVTINIVSSAETVREARIEGDVVVWTQGTNGVTRVLYWDLTWSDLAEPVVLGGPTPAARNVEIGDHYVVWERVIEEADGTYQRDIWAYDIVGGIWIPVSEDPNRDERRPTTRNNWIVWQSTGPNGMTLELADMSQDPIEIQTIVDMGADVERPTVDGDFVAFESTAAGNLDIYLYRISDGSIFQVTDHPDDQMLNNLRGDKVSYVDMRNDSLDVFVSKFSLESGPPPDPCADLGGDGDADQICDVQDNCPEVSNPAQVDADGDGAGDACDACPFDADDDADGDGACGDVDNCPDLANDQTDADGDGLGDACDPCPEDPENDADGNGVCANDEPDPPDGDGGSGGASDGGHPGHCGHHEGPRHHGCGRDHCGHRGRGHQGCGTHGNRGGHRPRHGDCDCRSDEQHGAGGSTASEPGLNGSLAGAPAQEATPASPGSNAGQRAECGVSVAGSSAPGSAGLLFAALGALVGLRRRSRTTMS